MDYRVWTGLHSRARDLARAEPFELGPLQVDPPSRRIAAGSRVEMVEPRVMRVLVALGEAPGRVLSRDDLIELCWDGQVVGDSAITRVVSMLRQVLADLAGDAVRIETITKVGFRLLADDLEGEIETALLADSSGLKPPSGGATALGEPTPFWRRKWTRRAAIGGVGASLAAAGGMTFVNRDRIALQLTDAGAAQLTREGLAIQKTGEFGSVRKALDRFKRATVIDPDYAPAWAAMALTFRHPVQGPAILSEPRAAQPRLVRAAAEKALALDPGNQEAQLALIVAESLHGHWLKRELQFRAFLRKHPGSALGNNFLGQLLSNVGRSAEGTICIGRSVEFEPQLVNAWGQHAMFLLNSGQGDEAHKVLDRAVARWPNHYFLWFSRFNILMWARQFGDAAAFARDSAGLPDMMPLEQAEKQAKLADELAAGHTGPLLVAEAICMTCNNVESAPFGVPLLVLCGAIDEAFAMAEAYLLGGTFAGQRIPPPSMTDDRMNFMLFTRPMLALTHDPRHASLLERIGLEEYWRKTGTQPDFRKG